MYTFPIFPIKAGFLSLFYANFAAEERAANVDDPQILMFLPRGRVQTFGTKPLVEFFLGFLVVGFQHLISHNGEFFSTLRIPLATVFLKIVMLMFVVKHFFESA